jgi:serine/threonine-protein kinase RsbW
MIIQEDIPSRLNVIPGFTLSLKEKLAHLSLKEEEIFNIQLCLEEALVNAIKHGNKLNPDLSVQVTVEAKDDSVIITVIDQGKGFDSKNIPDPTDTDNLQKLSGRGIFLIKKLMDKVEFFDCGRGIKMIKSLKKEVQR